MGELIAAHDWRSTALGPIQAWPPCLTSALALMLRSPLPMALMWGRDGVMLYNDAYAVLAGDRHPQILGAAVGDAWPEIAEFSQSIVRDVLAGGDRAFHDQELTLTRDGVTEPAWFDLAYSPVTDERGRPVGVFAVAVETTARVLADRARNESEAMFRTLAETMPAMMFLADTTGAGLYSNPQLQAYTGLSADDLLGSGWLGTGHPDELERAVATRDRLLQAQEALFVGEFRIRRFDGAQRWHVVRVVPVRDQAGRVVRWLALATDIHDRKLAELELRDTADRLQSEVEARTLERDRLFELSNDLLTIAGADGFLKVINPAWSRLLGYPETELMTRPFVEFVHPDDRGRVAEVMGSLEAGKILDHFENRYIRADGGLAWISWRAVQQGDLIYAVGRDVTQDRQRDEMLRQAQKMEAIGHLTGGIAHDFNNVLGAVIGSLDFIRRRPEDVQRVERFADAGLKAAERGAKLTSQLLAFSRARQIEIRPVDVTALIFGMRELLTRTLGPMVRLCFDARAEGELVLSDSAQLEMAVLNLAINARDAMPAGGELTIATALRRIDDDPVLKPGDYVELSVSDTGVGMAEEVAARAFDPFFTTKGLGKGAGLGLSQAYGVARQSGGTARIESRPGQGATVRLLLRRTEAPAAAASGPEREPARASETGATILAVDDDPDVRRVLVDGIEALGYQVREAADGPSALAGLEQGAPDLMIVDYAMPGMTGAQVAEAARGRFPSLPVIFVTGYADIAAIERAAGPKAVILRKPFRIGELQAAISKALKPG